MSAPAAERYDLVVLGGGPAGLAAARAAVLRGARVALIEQHLLGGVSLITGSVPSKSLIHSARLYAFMRDADETQMLSRGAPDFPAAMEKMRRQRMRIGAYHSAERLRLAGIQVLFGPAAFCGADCVRVAERTLKFRKAIIATGARPTETRIAGLEAGAYLTSEQVFDLTQCPRRLLVIGGGPQGCEFAQAFCRLGAHVVIAQNESKFLPMEERDAAQILSESMARDGVEIHLNSTVVAVRITAAGDKEVDLVSDDVKTTITVDQILSGIGRRPNVENLGLQAAGVSYDAQDGVHTDDWLRTSNDNIYAAGDVCQARRFTHVAEATGRLAVHNALFDGAQAFSALLIPWCTYTDPEIAHVGLYAVEARQQSIPIRTLTVLMQDSARAILEGQDQGFVKIHVRDGTDQILGATIVSAHAGELINEVTVAMSAGLGLLRLADIIHAYPTQAYALKMAADALVRAREPARSCDTLRPAWPVD